MAEADDPKPIQVGAYQRTIQARAVTFLCAHCGQETTIQQYPGYPPRYCSLECKRAVHRVRDRERKARQRAVARAAEFPEMSDALAQPSDSAATPPIPESVSDSLDRPSDTNTPPEVSTPPARVLDTSTTPPAPLAALANDNLFDGDDDWEDEEEAWDEDADDPYDDPVYDLQAVRLRPGQKRHLATDYEETLCGRELGYQAKELRGFDSRDCQRCFEKASALHLCCADCDKPLLVGGLPGRCRTCQGRYEKLVARGVAGDAPTPEVLKQRRVAAAESAYEQTQRKRERKALAEYEADWRWRQGLTPARSARPGDPFAWLEQQVSDERFADARDERLFGDPAPLPPTLAASDRTPATPSLTAPPVHEPLTSWPGPAERARPSWDALRPQVYGVAHLDAMLHLQRCLDLLDQHLMAPPHPALPPVTVGRSWITDGALYSFRHPELGLLGSVCLLGNGSSMRIDIQISGHADDPTTSAREAAFVPIATALSERFYASPMLVPKPGQPISAITTAPAYRDPQQQQMREYRCVRCQALVALLVLAEEHMGPPCKFPQKLTLEVFRAL